MPAREKRRVALQIAALLPMNKDAAEAVLALVEDIMEWRGYSPGASEISASASESRLGSEDTSPQYSQSNVAPVKSLSL